MLDLDMTPYAAFVWSSWAISALALGVVVARAVIASRRWKRDLDALEPKDTALEPQSRAQAAQGVIAPEDGAQAAHSAIAPTE